MNIVLDTNVLLVYFIGLYDSSFIHSFKRTNKYSKTDFLNIKNIVMNFSVVFITPQILAEISNFTFEIHEPKLTIYMKKLIRTIRDFKEDHIAMDKLIANENLICSIGFTDVSIIEVAKKNDCLILTSDFEMSQRAASMGCRALNYTNIMGLDWGYCKSSLDNYLN